MSEQRSNSKGRRSARAGAEGSAGTAPGIHHRAGRSACVLACLLLAAGSLLAITPGTAGAARPGKKARILALRQRLKAISKKKHEKRVELQQTKRTQVRLADQLNQSYEQLEEAQQALKQSQARLQRAQMEVRAATRRLQEAQARLVLQQQRFSRRITVSYKEGPVSYADVLLGSRNISDFLDRQYYVSRVMGQDAELLADLRRAQQEVAREREAVLQRQASLAEAHRENAAWVTRVQTQAEQRERLLRAIQHERALQERQLEELEEDSRDIQGSLERELIRRQANPRAFRALPRWSGKLFLPAHGRITSGFGYRYHPVLHYGRMHTGIDIGVAFGSLVFAAADGEVFFASWRGGYGRCIIVLHGGGMSTLYGHLSGIRVRPGQAVHRGQVIGASGNTGLSTGPHLHFEVRRNGVPVNPL